MRRVYWIVMSAAVLISVGFYVNRPKPLFPGRVQTAAGPAVQPPKSALQTSQERVDKLANSTEHPPAPAPGPKAAKPRTRVGATAANPADPALDASFATRTVEMLLSKDTSYQKKQEAWKQAREVGQLDRVIAVLEQGTAQYPQSAEYPATLGQAYLQKCATTSDLREQGILAMQADKLFDTALGLDPQNWEARFTKAMAMSYWPPMLNKGEEVIQQFSTLIQQQENQASQPQFADTYAWLGDQYQKANRADDARAVWERGAALFPADEKLRAKLAAGR